MRHAVFSNQPVFVCCAFWFPSTSRFFHCCVTICALKWLLTLKQHPLVPPPPCRGPKQHDAGTNHADTSGCVTTLRKGSDERWIYVIADRWHTLINKCYHERFKVRGGNWQHSNHTNLFIHVQFSQLPLYWKWIETNPFMGNFHTLLWNVVIYQAKMGELHHLKKSILITTWHIRSKIIHLGKSP